LSYRGIDTTNLARRDEPEDAARRSLPILVHAPENGFEHAAAPDEQRLPLRMCDAKPAGDENVISAAMMNQL
jgi:hypothetical protein